MRRRTAALALNFRPLQVAAGAPKKDASQSGQSPPRQRFLKCQASESESHDHAQVSSAKIVSKDNVGAILSKALEAGGGLLRLTPTWVPRSFLHPGKRIKLAPGDWYAFGAHRGGIDERWFASTTEAANDNRTPDEGLSYVTFGGQRFTLRDAVAEAGPGLIGKAITTSTNAGRCTRNSSTTWARSRITCTKASTTRSSSARKASRKATIFRRKYNNVDNNFAYTFMGLEPGTTRPNCANAWKTGTKGTTAFSISRGPTA